MAGGRPKKIVKTVPRKWKPSITDYSDEPEEGNDHEDHIFKFHDSLKTDHALEAEGATDSEDERISEWDEDDEKLTVALRVIEMRMEMEDGEWESLKRVQRQNLKRKASSVSEHSYVDFASSSKKLMSFFIQGVVHLSTRRAQMS
jgi:hypothetical protein